MGAGGRPSWVVGPYAAQGFVSGSNGFPGFADYTAGTWRRGNVAAYGDVELGGPADRWMAGAALRVEHFDVIGGTTNGKLSARYRLSGAVSARGGVSTGFRAPTPGQQNTLNVQTTLNDRLELVDSGTVPSTFRAARLRGGRPLVSETSVNTTAGLVVDAGPFTLTADYFRIDVADRLALSQTFTPTPDERALLLSEGITSAGTLTFFRFFINDFSTSTQGVDVVSTWAPSALGGGTVFSFALNHTRTNMTEETDLLGPGDVLALERGVPRTRWNAAVTRRLGRASLLGRLHCYGDWIDLFDARFVSGAEAPILGGRYIVDLELGVPLGAGVTLSAGGQNLLTPSPTATKDWPRPSACRTASSRRGASAAGTATSAWAAAGAVKARRRLPVGAHDGPVAGILASTASHATSSQPWNTSARPTCRTEGARRRSPSSAR